MENIVIKDKDGKELEYKVLLTFDISEKSYVIYTDSIADENEMKIYYAYYKKEDFTKLEPVENEDEIKIIDDIVADFEKGLRGEL